MKSRITPWLAGGLAVAAFVAAGFGLLDYLKQRRAAADHRAALRDKPINTPIEFLSADLQAPLPAEIVPFFELFARADAARRRAALTRIEAAWQPTYASMVLEVLMLGESVPEPEALWDLLARKTGYAGGTDYKKWSVWIWNHVPDTHPHYPEFKSLLSSNFDIRFREHFPAGVPHTIRLDEIRWGGVSRNGIPPLVRPKCIPAAAAGFLEDGHVVFGVYIDGVARAYPQRILGWHEMVRDRIGKQEITGVYCTLCQAMIVYDSAGHTFGTSGLLYRSNKLMFDEATKSLWSTFEGQPVVGPLVGKQIQLASFPVVTTTWGEWKQRHPDTTVLSLATGHVRDYGEGVAYYAYYADDRLWFVVPHLDPVLANKDEVLCLRDPETPEEPVAIAVAFLKNHTLYEVRVGKLDMLVLTDASGASRVYERSGRHFVAWAGADVVDDAGHSWQVSENALSHAGSRLPRLPAHRAFWFGWHAAYPKARLVKD
ncbi:MAG: DUF3179 domain-containing protein [Gemmataceae bacterium]